MTVSESRNCGWLETGSIRRQSLCSFRHRDAINWERSVQIVPSSEHPFRYWIQQFRTCLVFGTVVSFYNRYAVQIENFIYYAALIKDLISLIQVEDKTNIFIFRSVINEIYWMSLEFYTLSNKERRRYDFEFNNIFHQ